MSESEENPMPTSTPTPVSTPIASTTPIISTVPNKRFLQLDYKIIARRFATYLIEGLVIAMACLLIPKNTIHKEDVITIALIGMACFSMLDLFSPNVSSGMRSGAGLGLGMGLVGGVPIRTL